MRYIVVLGDGMADRPLPCLNGKTPLEAAYKPHIDSLCARGVLGQIRTLYDDLPAGSDVANLSVLGFDPHLYYTGRSPIEALGLGIPLGDNDIVFRLNLVTLSGDEIFEEKTMIDYSSEKISTEEATELIKALAAEFSSDIIKIYPGVSYRHIFILKNKECKITLTPPHDILGRNIAQYLPKAEKSGALLDMMKKSYELLSAHPVNKRRVSRGLRPANCLWLWGQGKKPKYKGFPEIYGVRKGMAITAVPLIKGLAAGLGLDSCDIPGATGDYYTNYEGKANAAIKALRDGYDFVFIHIEAPDECGHDGDAELKKASIEKIDKFIVGPVCEAASKLGEPFKIIVMPDHATPIEERTHTKEIIPFILYDSRENLQDLPFRTNGAKGLSPYCERVAASSPVFIRDGFELMGLVIEK